MGKKNKKQQTTLPQREVFMRMNFLYQVMNYSMYRYVFVFCRQQ